MGLRWTTFYQSCVQISCFPVKNYKEQYFSPYFYFCSCNQFGPMVMWIFPPGPPWVTISMGTVYLWTIFASRCNIFLWCLFHVFILGIIHHSNSFKTSASPRREFYFVLDKDEHFLYCDNVFSNLPMSPFLLVVWFIGYYMQHLWDCSHNFSTLLVA